MNEKIIEVSMSRQDMVVQGVVVDKDHTFKITVKKKTVVRFLEIPDVHFHHNSAIPCLDGEGNLLGLLADAFVFAKENPDMEVVLFGHSDTSGEPAYNFDLSEWRAGGVKALLDGDVKRWLDVVDLASKVEDYQAILKALSIAYGWDCDPGEVDSIAGSKTAAAVKEFQSRYKNDFQAPESFKVDGIIGPKTWEAFFEVIRSFIEKIVKQEIGQEIPVLTYGYEGEGLYPCGESFPIDQADNSNYRSKENRRVEVMFYDKGNAPELIKPADKTKIEIREATVFDKEKTELKPVKAKSRGVESDPEGDIFLDTASDELGIVTPDNMKQLKKEIEWYEAFLPHMKVFIPSKDGNEKDSAAQANAVLFWMKAFVDAASDAEAQSIVDTLDSKIAAKKEELLDEIEKYGSVKAAGHKMKPGDIQEYYWVTGKRMVRIRSQKIRPHNRWFNKKQVLQQINAEQKKTEEARNTRSGPAKELEVKLFEKKLFSKDGSLSPSIEEFNKNCNMNFFNDSEVFDADIGAQFLRYSAEAAFGANVNWKEEKTIKAGLKAEGSFALAQAQGHFDIKIPNADGFDFVGFLKSVDEQLVKHDCGNIFLLIQLTTKGSAFVGACAAVSMEVGVSVKSTSTASGGGEAGLELFAGAKVGADATLGLKMKLIDDKDTKANVSPKAVDWTTLGDIAYGAWAAVGIGIEAAFKLGYYDQRLRFMAKIGLVLKAGAGTFIKGSVDPLYIGKLIWTIGNSLDWIHMSDVLEKNVYDFYQGLMANCFYTGKAIAEVVGEFGMQLDAILSSTKKASELGLGELKKIDDTFDKYIPGYSGFKQFHVGFLLLKSTYHYLKTSNTNDAIKEAAIKQVNKAEREKLWNYATWQMKANLIYDMRFDGSGMLIITEEEKEDAVILVLRSCRNAHEFRKLVTSLEKGDKSLGRNSVSIDSMLDFSQQTEFDKMKIMHGI